MKFLSKSHQQTEISKAIYLAFKQSCELLDFIFPQVTTRWVFPIEVGMCFCVMTFKIAVLKSRT